MVRKTLNVKTFGNLKNIRNKSRRCTCWFEKKHLCSASLLF